jgi:hypothetical protein
MRVIKNNDMSSINSFENIFKEHIKIETSQKSIDNLFTRRMTSKTNYKPYYQRNYVWDDNKATHFIESIFLGTELPPLIFFDSDNGIEIIDGRQRYETIKRFMDDEFSLKQNGLSILTQLKNLKYSQLSKKSNDLLEHFLDCKIRIIHFQIVNHPPLDPKLQDRVKKEIFLRYNSGITPLKKEEVDDARYDEDLISNFFKNKINKSETVYKMFVDVLFSGHVSKIYKKVSLAKIISQVRTELVLPSYPIAQFSKGGAKKIAEKLYEFFTKTNSEQPEIIYDNFINKVEFLNKILKYSSKNKLKTNHLAMRGFLWALSIMEIEQINFSFDNNFTKKCAIFINDNIQFFSTEYSTRRENIFNRYVIIQKFFESEFDLSLSAYLDENSSIAKIKKEIRNKKATTKLEKLKDLGLSKPEPSNMSIEDVSRKMNRRKFLVRPSYQRVEVINKQKKSSIIESVLLGIKLPPIFIYKRLDDVYEVIDGQQRLLTLLGFTGSEYTDQDNKVIKSKDNEFKLSGLRILTELNGKKFNELNENDQNKIYDFQLYIVEIDANKNPNFNPIDLFIRLNDKPYPIKTNSFEMWNSWVDVDLIDQIKQLKNVLIDWFYIKKITKKSDRDRMENEELITSLAYIEYHSKSKQKVVDIYQKDNINIEGIITSKLISRVSSKLKINALMLEACTDITVKKEFLNSIKKVKSVIRNLKLILIDRNKEPGETTELFLNNEIEKFVKVSNTRKLQNFYFLWILINKTNFNLVKIKRKDMKKDLLRIFKIINAKHTGFHKNNINNRSLINLFNSHSDVFLSNYTSKAMRKRKLSKKEKEEMIKRQGYKSSISGVPIFDMDDLEVDHTIPLAVQGQDEIDNMGLAHGKENREKGSNFDLN